MPVIKIHYFSDDLPRLQKTSKGDWIDLYLSLIHILTIFFTNTMSHKMVQGALSELKGRGTIIERCHTSSLSALRGILDKYAAQGAC